MSFTMIYFHPKPDKLCISDTLLCMHIPININLIINRNNITCGSETCISSVLLYYIFNKWQSRIMSEFDHLFQNDESTQIAQIMKDIYEGYRSKIYPNNSHIHHRAYGFE